MQDRQQIYGRNDMVMLEKHNKIYGSLGLTEPFVFDTIKGENRVVLKNPKEGNFEDVVTEFNIYGMSEQESTTGANLIDVDSMLNECLVKNDDGTYSILKTETDRFSESFPVNLKAGTKIRFDADVIEYNGVYPLKLQIFFGRQTISDGKSIFLNEDTRELKIYQDGQNDVGTYTKFKNAILSIGEERIQYEPYTGGKPSPSPDYPQEIKNVGKWNEEKQKYEVDVKVTGKNLIPFPYLDGNKLTRSGITYTVLQEGSVHCIGKATEPSYFRLASKNFGNSIEEVNENFKLKDCFYNINNKLTSINFYPEEGEINTVKFPIVLMSNIENQDYEPYKEPQSLVLQTPNGLSGIKVESGGNYTDETGQQWICDEIDLERGKYVQRIIKNIFDGSEQWYTWGANPNGNIGFYYYLNRYQSVKMSGSKCISNYLPYEREALSGNNIGVNIIEAEQANLTYIVVSVKQSDLTDVSTNELAVKSFNGFLKSKKDSGIPFEIYCKLMEPIETDLPPEIIEAYKQLRANYPTTVITADGGELPVGMEVTYKQVNKG